MQRFNYSNQSIDHTFFDLFVGLPTGGAMAFGSPLSMGFPAGDSNLTNEQRMHSNCHLPPSGFDPKAVSPTCKAFLQL
jgi:hypothetical protein